MHMRIQRNESGQYILGQFSRPFDTVPDMIRHFCLNRLPVRGAEHMCLIEPVIVQLLWIRSTEYVYEDANQF